MDLLRRGGRLLTALLVLATAAPAARAQLSPGPLATPHANLEGMKNCTQCHALGKGVEADKCLACHTLLAERITAGKGLHAGADHANCVSCHSEHHGADYALVHWEGGEANFDHAAAGFTLEGAHAALKCRQCHREDKIANPARLTAAHKDLDRSFLGLGTACLDCHTEKLVSRHKKDETKDCLQCHRSHGPKGTEAPKACVSCHDKPLPGLHDIKDHKDCANCHGFHDKGPRRGRSSCITECHQDQLNHEPTANSCVGCHPFERKAQ